MSFKNKKKIEKLNVHPKRAGIWAASSNIETISASLQLCQMKSVYKCHKYVKYEILSNIDIPELFFKIVCHRKKLTI